MQAWDYDSKLRSGLKFVSYPKGDILFLWAVELRVGRQGGEYKNWSFFSFILFYLDGSITLWGLGLLFLFYCFCFVVVVV